MKPGYYLVKDNGRPIIVWVNNCRPDGHMVFLAGDREDFELCDFDFGENPQPLDLEKMWSEKQAKRRSVPFAEGYQPNPKYGNKE